MPSLYKPAGASSTNELRHNKHIQHACFDMSTRMFLESRIPRFTPRAFFIHPLGAKSVFFGIRVERHVLNSVSPSRRFERPVLNGTKVIVWGIRSRLPRSALPYPSWLNVLLPLPQLFPSAASAAFCFTMVTRLVKRAKFIRWRIDFAKKRRVKTWKHTL